MVPITGTIGEQHYPLYLILYQCHFTSFRKVSESLGEWSMVIRGFVDINVADNSKEEETIIGYSILFALYLLLTIVLSVICINQ